MYKSDMVIYYLAYIMLPEEFNIYVLNILNKITLTIILLI